MPRSLGRRGRARGLAARARVCRGRQRTRAHGHSAHGRRCSAAGFAHALTPLLAHAAAARARAHTRDRSAAPHRGKHVLPRGAQVLQARAHARRGGRLEHADVHLRQVALEQRRVGGADVLADAVQQVQRRQLALRARLRGRAGGQRVNPRDWKQPWAGSPTRGSRRRHARTRAAARGCAPRRSRRRARACARAAGRRACRMCFSMAAATLAAATGPCALAISPAMMVRLVIIGLLLNVSSASPSWYCAMSSTSTGSAVMPPAAATRHAARSAGSSAHACGGTGCEGAAREAGTERAA